jgi:Rrf2 family transcriptional regulator, cysteine metabolism repressor
MRLSQKCHYALRALLELALGGQDEPRSIATLSLAQVVPEQFLHVIMRELRQGGYVASRRGKAGGYLLARPARDIRLGEVIRFVEGELIAGDDAAVQPAALAELWREAQAALAAQLDAVSLAELAARQRQLVAGPGADYVI